MMPAACLVTGVGGFIGSHLADRLVADGHDVLGIDRFVNYYPRSLKEANLQRLKLSSRFRFVEADLNEVDLRGLLQDRQWVFHQAAQARVRASWGSSFAGYVACNIQATQLLLEAAVHAPSLERLVFASSSSVYGDVMTLPVNEETLPRPLSPYGVTKLAAEHLCRLYWQIYRVPTVSLRYFTVYGPRQRPDMAFHRFGKALLEDAVISLNGDGTQTRDFTFVDDVVQANLQAATCPGVEGRVFNIAGGARVSLRDAISLLELLSGRTARVESAGSAPGDVRDTYADTASARRELEWPADRAPELRELFAVPGNPAGQALAQGLQTVHRRQNRERSPPRVVE